MMAKATKLTAHRVRTMAISRPVMKRNMEYPSNSGAGAAPSPPGRGKGRSCGKGGVHLSPPAASGRGRGRPGGTLFLGEIPLERVIGSGRGEQIGMQHPIGDVAHIVPGDVVALARQADADHREVLLADGEDLAHQAVALGRIAL